MGNENIETAISKEIKQGMSISTELSPETGPADKQILIRLTETDRERWKQAADSVGLTVSQMIRDVVNDFAEKTLDCSHPINRRRYYPWSEVCLECGTRLK